MAAFLINGSEWKSGDLKISPVGPPRLQVFFFFFFLTHTGGEVNGVASAESRCDMTAASWEHGCDTMVQRDTEAGQGAD